MPSNLVKKKVLLFWLNYLYFFCGLNIGVEHLFYVNLIKQVIGKQMILNSFTFINGCYLDLFHFFDTSSVKIKIWRKLIFLTNFNAHCVNSYIQQSWSFLMKSFVIIMKCILWLLLYHVMEERVGIKLSWITHISQSTCKSAEFC